MLNIKNKSNILLSIFAIFILLNLVIFPKQVLKSSSDGILLWFNVVFPSLFPFLVTLNIITLTGSDKFLGAILSPFVKKTFNVSSKGSLPFLLGFLSGYPIGAKIVSDLYINKSISTTEAQRIMSFSNNPSLLFVIGTVATGLLNNSALGYILILSTFLSSILCGVIFRFYGTENLSQKKHTSQDTLSLPLGKILNQSVSSALSTVTIVGGFIILFSVISAILSIWGVFDFLSNILCTLTNNALPAEYFVSLLTGILEMTGGIKLISQSSLPLQITLPTIAAMLYFGGFSVLAQTMSIISETPIKIPIYILSRIIGGIFSFILCKLFLNIIPFTSNQAMNVSTFSGAYFLPNMQFSVLICVFFLVVALKIKKRI